MNVKKIAEKYGTKFIVRSEPKTTLEKYYARLQKLYTQLVIEQIDKFIMGESDEEISGEIAMLKVILIELGTMIHQGEIV